jgi:hypothetical protein
MFVKFFYPEIRRSESPVFAEVVTHILRTLTNRRLSLSVGSGSPAAPGMIHIRNTENLKYTVSKKINCSSFRRPRR